MEPIMNVYSVNKGIGYASSGVEYAQKYRKELFEEIDVNDYYIFLDYLSTNITVYTDLLGYHQEQILWIYNFLSERNAELSTYSVDRFLSTIDGEYEIVNQTDKTIDVKVTDNQSYKIWLLEGNVVDRVDYIVNGNLVNVRHYDKVLNNIETYHQGQLVKRAFFDINGYQRYEQYYVKNEITVTLIDNQILYGKMAFYQYFFHQLRLNQSDAVIIDRPLDVVEGILPVLANQVRLFSVVHAEHYNESLSTATHILWNNNYEYVFENADYFEAIIVATERQNKILSQQLKTQAKIVTIPVGYISQITKNNQYQPYSLITASRLASEKHIDIVIRGVVMAHEKIPLLTLDIFGEGGERRELEALIKTLNASDFIQLKGHQNVNKLYAQYSGYISASTSEGFGLSLLEALGSSLPFIGIDVDYGNREFIENGQNGILFPKDNLKEMPFSLAQSIISFYEQNLAETGRQSSADKAGFYLKKNVAKKWAHLLDNREDK